jgi:FMN hydrolase / 5-amino-6-(5-phospho-D-ribitylamino)uracil phosphatase
VMADSYCVGAKKPDPAIFRAALGALGATAETTLYIGDSLRRDGEGARRMGLSFVWISSEGAGGATDGAPPVAAAVTRLPQLLDLLA